MTLRVRRILSLIFIIFFLIIAPAIILYAAGYKLKRNGFSIERTGMFIVETKPRGAKIFLNGKAQKTLVSALLKKNDFITTPAKIKDLLPGEYDVSLVLDGYSSWHKKLSINPGASTFVKNVYLFKNSLPIQIAPHKIQAISFSPAKNQALIISTDQLTLFNLWSETEKSTEQNNLNGKNIIWSTSGQKFVIDSYLYNIDDLNFKFKTDLSKLTLGLSDYKWRDDVLFYRDKTSIYRLNQNLPKKIINHTEFSDYLVKEGNLYLVSQSKLSAKLVIIDLATNKQIKEIGLPAPANYSFINPDQALINLYDNDHRTLYLIEPLYDYTPPLVEIINDVKTTFWSDSNNLLYTNDFEIWLYNLASKEKTLITRISDLINSAVIHPNKNYIIYSTGRTIDTIELDDREKRNITELVKFDYIGPFSLSLKGDTLYFSGKIGNSEGLYKLSIQ